MTISLSRFIYQTLRPYPVPLLIMVAVAIMWAAQTSLLPYLLKLMLNRVASEPQGDPFVMLSGLVILYLGASLVMVTLFRLYGYFAEYKMIPELRKQIGTRCVNHLLKLSHQFYQNSFAGSLGSKVSELVMTVSDLLQMVIDRFFSHILALFIAAFTLWQVNLLFALILLGWTLGFLSVPISQISISLPWRRIGPLKAIWSPAKLSIRSPTCSLFVFLRVPRRKKPG